jgi:hypothetical protein
MIFLVTNIIYSNSRMQENSQVNSLYGYFSKFTSILEVPVIRKDLLRTMVKFLKNEFINHLGIE